MLLFEQCKAVLIVQTVFINSVQAVYSAVLPPSTKKRRTKSSTQSVVHICNYLHILATEEKNRYKIISDIKTWFFSDQTSEVLGVPLARDKDNCQVAIIKCKKHVIEMCKI